MLPPPPAAALSAACALLCLLRAPAPVQAASKLPSSFKRCSAEDPQPKVSECLRDAVEEAFRSMKDGFPSLGVLPIDPMEVNEIDILQNGAGPVSMSMNLRNITLRGLSKSTITNYSANLDKRTLYTVSLTPLVQADFLHNISGRVLLLPIRGAGPGTINFHDLYCDHALTFSPFKKKDGRLYWRMDKYIIHLKPVSVQLDFEGLFSEDSRLSEQMRSFVKQNSRVIFDELKGSMEEAFGALFQEVTDRIFTKVPVDDIFIFTKDPKQILKV